MDPHSSTFYELHYTKQAEKFFAAHPKVLDQYKAAMKELLTGAHPERLDIKMIRGKHNAKYYQLRINEYRIIYTIINGRIIVINTLLAGARDDIYKKMHDLD